ncbi:DNA helicase [Vreelandella aquamarina]|jgi:superfamily I DNA/RNA helicase|uniref:DNA 3'-5' helicase n=1 Tax=Vreelandella aquamarina TaxID=77097 RepID=A0A6F8XFD1_9GAMM|nr:MULTISPECIES: ATP-dependent helicase [Oceanospirillales]MAP34418.1 DNA helicase UvrD [Halomonas sp.]MBS97597.1 DNA helicase UvrD [Oceanospirillaceae bacterium]MCE7524003.1 ATP-dependent helicase [Alloalcanivorax xenomutans]BCB72818.1 DNA helicase [Halomonas meridiana]
MITVGDWQPADGLTLEPNALRAARETERCLALTAGPGAGKTEMLAQRADFLLRTGTCRYPKRILAISFKVDASKNLKERVQRRCGSDLAARFDSYTFHAFAKRIIDRFRPVLTGRDALDVNYQIGDRRVTRRQIEFSDLVPLAIQILNTSVAARNAVRQTYSDVFLDEFQDCTDQQYALVKLAFQGTAIRLTAVGDTKQKIMGWAGALDGIFQTFAADFVAEPLNMYRNFRSKPRLLRMQNEIIKVMDSTSVMPDEQLAGEEGQIFAWQFPNSQEEAEHLADSIDTWINHEQLPPSEIAILVVRQPDLYGYHLIQALEQRRIPFRNEQQLQDISVEPAARLIVDYLSILYGQREPKAWIRLMAQLIPFADDDVQSSVRRDFQNFIAGQRKSVVQSVLLGEPFADWWDFVRAFLSKVGIETLSALSHDYESKARLVQVVNDTKTRVDELLKSEPNLPKALERFSDDQAVRLLTIHKSKGLEFDTVVILGVENQSFWGEEDAERCAFFVGVSRAKKRLMLTVSDRRDTPPSNPRRWKENRTPHSEFLGYAMPFLSLGR